MPETPVLTKVLFVSRLLFGAVDRITGHTMPLSSPQFRQALIPPSPLLRNRLPDTSLSYVESRATALRV